MFGVFFDITQLNTLVVKGIVSSVGWIVTGIVLWAFNDSSFIPVLVIPGIVTVALFIDE